MGLYEYVNIRADIQLHEIRTGYQEEITEKITSNTSDISYGIEL